MAMELAKQDELKVSFQPTFVPTGLMIKGKVTDESCARRIIDFLVEACQLGEIKLLRSRLTQSQKEEIGPGQIYVYCQEDSFIQRWTDGKLWAPSKIVGNFLHYHELYRRYSPYQKVYCPQTKRCMPKFHPQDIQDFLDFKQQMAFTLGAGEVCVRLKGLFVYKNNGLLKKTYTMKCSDKTYHLVAYESKGSL